MCVAGIDGCRAGWVAFRLEIPSLASSVELVDVAALFRKRPDDLVCVGIDIPIGLMTTPRACDREARKLLGQRRLFPAPCRESLTAADYRNGSAINRKLTGRGLSLQSWAIASKIKQVDDAITNVEQAWVREVHPEVCFWALAKQPMQHRKKTEHGLAERLRALQSVLPGVENHLVNRQPGIAKDDVIDAASAAWTALRITEHKARSVCAPEEDDKGLTVAIWY